MKRIVVYVICLFTLVNCTGKSHNSDIVQSCTSRNILCLLKDSIANDFLQEIESSKKMQSNSDSVFYIDVNKDLLYDFINKIDLNVLEKENYFSIEYKRLCGTDRTGLVLIEFYQAECAFRLVVINKYSTLEFDNESSVSYSFQILNQKIRKFKRFLAG
jgi:hypothetical protein